MKRIAAMVLAWCICLTLFTGVFAADDSKTTVMHGEYTEERLIEPFDETSHGIIAFPKYETFYDFDRETLPQSLTSVKSKVEISDKYHGTTASRSLKWTTQGPGSSIMVSSGSELFHYWNGMGAVGLPLDWKSTWFLTVGVFQEEMPADGSTRSFKISLICNGADAESYNFYLHRKGWTVFGNGVGLPMNTVVNSISITQTAGPPGDVYVDDLALYVRNSNELRKTPYAKLPELYSERAKEFPTHELTEEEKEAFSTIAERAFPELQPIERLSDKQMEEFREYYKMWNITPVEGTNFVNGYCPLQFHRATPGNITNNMDNYSMNKDYKTLCSTYQKLGSSYNVVKDPEQKAELKKYVIDIAKLAITYSNVPDSWYGGRGFAEGAYYARDALQEAGLAADMSRQLKEQYGVDAILYSEHVFDNPPEIQAGNNASGGAFQWGIDADNLYNGSNATMISLLVDADSPEKARDMYMFKDYMDKLLLNYTPGYNGTMKPDGSLVHHAVNKYDYGWRQAWDGITKYVYWFHDTPFAPSQETIERVNHMAEVRYKDLGMDGKGGVPGHQGTGSGTSQILRLAQSGMPDGSLDVNPYRAAEWMAYGNGGTEANAYVEMGIKPANLPQSNLTLSYAMKNIHKRSGWRVQTYAESKYAKFNEYIRPAALFFNLGGIMLDVTGQHAAMLEKPGDNIYGRDSFNPSPGYDFSRAPGVTSADVIDKTQLTAIGKGSSGFVGGVSTQNGNGVFTNQFDSTDNSADYGNSPANNFRFKKSYFYFDNMIVCLASNIGYGGTEAVTTGLFQEKMKEDDSIDLSGGRTLGAEEYKETYSSDEVPWLSDNIEQAMFYLFPGQSYTVSRGTQQFLYKPEDETFDGKGNFTAAYINHPASDVKINQGSYAYIIAPSASTERMKDLENSMKSENPQFEILSQNEDAHVVRDNFLNSTGYVVFNKAATFKEGAVEKVSAPSVIMTKTYEDGSGMSIAIADPDLRVAVTTQNKNGEQSKPRDIMVTLRGRWQIKESAKYTAREIQTPQIKYTANGKTLITVTCQDGLTNEYMLENIDKPLSGELTQSITLTPGDENATVNGEKIELFVPVHQRDGVEMVAALDIAKMLGSPIEWDDTEKRVNIMFNDDVLTFTVNSKVATKGNDIMILEHEMVMENDRNYLPVSVLKDILKTNVLAEGDSVTYIRNDAEWKNWNEMPAPPILPCLDGISVGGEALDFNKNVREYSVEVPEGTVVLPEVTYTVGDNYMVSVAPAQKVPGRTVLTLTDKADRLNTSLYTVKYAYPNSNYKVYASVTPQAENSADNTMDGDFATYWACNTNGGFITYELEKPVLYNGIGIAFIAGNKRLAFFKVEVSEDGENWTEVFNGESCGTTLDLERISFEPIKGRFIRIIGFGNSTSEWFSVSEVEIYKTNL